MMLKEFDLDAPEMSKWDRHAFRNQTRCVTALFERQFARFHNEQKAWKLLIEIVPSVSRPAILNLTGVLVLQVQGEPAQLLQADSSLKQRMTLDWLVQGAVKIARECDWPEKLFLDAADAVIAAGFKNEWVWKRMLWNKNRTMKAGILVEHDIEEARIFAFCRDRKGQLLDTRLLCSTPPSEFLFVPCLGKARWLSNHRFELSSKLGDAQWHVTFPKQ